MVFTRYKKKLKKIFGFFVITGLILVICFFYYQSNLIKNNADILLKYGDVQEAINLYKRAQALFPLRGDIDESISGANLILTSKADYESIVEFAELQTPPPISSLPTTKFRPDELFIPILMYHHIRTNPMPNNPVWANLNVSPDKLNQQLYYFFTHNYHAITLNQLFDAVTGKTNLPNNPVVITFDDGYRNFYENAFPLLKKYNMKATEFVITQVVGIPAYLTWNQILEMDKSGLVEIGAHTRHHPNLPDLSQQEITNEIKGSKQDLETHLGHPIEWFAYPYGSYSDFIIQSVKDAGFKGATSTIYGVAQSKDNIYLLQRIGVDGRFSLSELVRRIQQ